MFNSPLQYCAKCKQYVELDQSKEECAALHDCDGLNCPQLKIFRPPAPMDEMEPAVVPELPTSPGNRISQLARRQRSDTAVTRGACSPNPRVLGAIGKNAAYFNSHRMMRRYAIEAYIR